MNNTSDNPILKNQEIQGFYITSVARLFLLATIFATHIVTFENPIILGIASFFSVVMLGISGFLMYKTYRTGEVEKSPIVGVVFDVIVLIYMPIVWYLALGGTEISPAFMTKSMYFFVVFVVLIINIFSMHTFFPLIISIGGVLSYVSLLVYSVFDPEILFSNSLLDVANQDTIVLNFQIAAILGILLAGAIGSYLIYTFKNLIISGEQTENNSENETDVQKQIRKTYFPSVEPVSILPKTNELATSPNDSLFSSSNFGAATEKSEEKNKKILEQTSTSKKVAVLYADIRDFNKLSDTLSAERVMDMLSVYQEIIIPVIKDLGGSIEKSDGDGVLATFGATMPRTTDCERAVRAGIRIQNQIPLLNKMLMERKLPPINIGVGVHFGSVIVGSVSFYGSFERTIVGDTVDTTRRVESACRTTEKTLLFTGSVREKLPESFIVRAVGYCKLRGKEEKIELFTATTEPAM